MENKATTGGSINEDAKILAFSPTEFVASIDCSSPTNLTVFYGILRGKRLKIHKWFVSLPRSSCYVMCFHVMCFPAWFHYVRMLVLFLFPKSFKQIKEKVGNSLIMISFAEKNVCRVISIVWPINVREFFPIMQSGLNLNGVQNTCTTSSPQHTNAAPLHPANCQFIEQSH